MRIFLTVLPSSTEDVKVPDHINSEGKLLGFSFRPLIVYCSKCVLA